VKHAINVPSVLTGRRVRWTFELSAERQEIPVSIPPLASGPPTPARAESIVMRRGALALGLVLAVAAVGVVSALAVVRHLASDEEYEVADPSFAAQVATDRDSIVEPIASAPATPPAPPTATAAPVDLVTPGVRPIAAKQAVAEVERTPPGKGTKIVAVSVPAPTTVATPLVDTHHPEEARPPLRTPARSGSRRRLRLRRQPRPRMKSRSPAVSKSPKTMIASGCPIPTARTPLRREAGDRVSSGSDRRPSI
jgi:hypothetical protein